MGTGAFGYKNPPNKIVRRLIANSTNKWGQLINNVSDPIQRATPAATLQGTIVGDNLIIFINGTTSYTSPDGITWTTRTIPAGIYGHPAMNLLSTAYANGVYLYIGSATDYYTSTDGINWTLRTLPASVSGMFYFRMYGYNGMFFYHDGGNPTSTYYTSTDGINWTSRTAPASNSGMSLIGINGMFLWSGGGNFYSSNGINWTASSFGVPSSIGYANGKYVAFGSTIYTSPDFVNWTPVKIFPDFTGGFVLTNGAMVLLTSEQANYWIGSLVTAYITSVYKTDPDSELFLIKRLNYAASSGVGLWTANVKAYPFKNSLYVLHSNIAATIYFGLADFTNVYEIITEV